MDPISRLNRLMETLRQQMAQSTKRSNASVSDTRGPKETTREQNQRLTVPELRRQIQDRIKALDPGSPDRDRQARRIFVESVLAWEFGEALVLDHQFHRLIEGIQETFEQDSETNRALTEVLTELARH